MLKTVRALLAFAAVVPVAVCAELFTGKVTEVHEGDILKVVDAAQTEYKVRIAAIDAPELQQSYGAASRRHLALIVIGMPVTVEWRERDKSGALIAKVLQGSTDVGLLQLREGMAWYAKKDEQTAEDRRAYADAEAQARKERVGLWRERRPKAPWDFRGKTDKTGS
jgi:endonuclease YncB( thermonuclease family)